MRGVESSVRSGEDQVEAVRTRGNTGDPRQDTDITSDVVIRSLTDMLIMPAGMIQPQERAFAADLLQQVVHAAGDAAKRTLSERLAGLSEVPAALVRWMLTEFSDALLEPLLRNGICVSDTDLLALVHNGGPERLRLIAGRAHLPCVASAALAGVGDLDAVSELLRNPAARIDEPTLARLSERAIAEPGLRDLIVMRPELTPSCALHLFWVLGPKWRAHVFRRFLTDCQVLPQVFVMARPGGDLIAGALRCAERGGAGGAEAVPASGRAAAAGLAGAVEAADMDDIARHIRAMGLACDDAASRIARDTGGEALAVACKAAGVSRFSFHTACTAWRGRVAAGATACATADDLQIVFDTLSFKQARMALTYWNWQAAGSGPYLAFAA